jgi:type IV secretion system protein VirB11
MSLHPLKAETTARGARMLRTAFGPGIAAWLEDLTLPPGVPSV